jgi:hypothetical protein
MGVKKRNSFAFNWGTTLNSNPWSPNVPLSGTTTGAMASTNTIYSNVQDLGNFDNAGLIVTWTGTPTGTISVLVSELGDFFYPLTFNPALTQPAGAPGGYAVNLNQLPWRFVAIQYSNSSGTGSLFVSLGQKDLN